MSGEEETSFPVTLHVYDISQGLARQLSASILGCTIDAVYHTGLVVYGTEYWFGGGMETGIPGRTYFGPPHQVIPLGFTSVPKEVFLEFLDGIKEKFNPFTYSLLRNNCNHFSEELSQFLVGQGIPPKILHLPETVLNSPNGPLLYPLLQNLEASLRAGAPPSLSSGMAANLAAGAPMAPLLQGAASYSSFHDQGNQEQARAESSLPAAVRASDAPKQEIDLSVAPANHQLADRNGDADSLNVDGVTKQAIEQAIRTEFAALMAAGGKSASEAAAEALRRVQKVYVCKGAQA